MQENLVENKVSFDVDSFIKNKDKAFYALLLEDGRTIFQDDGRYNTVDPAWLRIKEFLETNRIRVKSVKIHFRSNSATVLEVPEDYDGIYFCNRAQQDLSGFEYAGEQITQFFMRFGLLKDNKVYYTDYRVPELLVGASGTLEKFKQENIISGIC